MSRSTQDFLESTGMPYLAKPFLVEEVKLAVRRALDNRAENEDENKPPLAVPGNAGSAEERRS